MSQIPTNSPLLSRYDRDPGRWRPYKYGCLIDVPVAADGAEEGTITIMNQPFIMDRISHIIVGDTWDPNRTGLAQDGQYYIQWKDEQSEYQNQPLLAIPAFGTEEFPLYLSMPIGFAGQKTLTFRVINAYQRRLTPEADTFRVQIVIHGASDWGTDRR
jgi:hypothetical protein